MAESIQSRSEPDRVSALLTQAEVLIDQASHELDDPIQLNELKTAQFTLSQIRANRR